MIIDNYFDLLIAVVFFMSHQLGEIGPKSQYHVIYFRLGEGETFQQFHLIALQAQSKNLLLKDSTWKINNSTGKYIMELSKSKHLQRYMTSFEPEYRNFEQLSQRNQRSTTFHFKIEGIF